MDDKQYTDEQLIAMITSGGNQGEKALKYIFLKWGKYTKAILLKAKAEKSDIDDAIMDAIVILDNSIRNRLFQSKSSLKNYFIGICKNRIRDNKRSTKRIDWTDDNLKMDGVDMETPETRRLKEEELKVLYEVVNQLEKRCKEVIILFINRYSYKEIAEKIGLNNDGAARQLSFRCRKRLRELAFKHSLFMNLFKDRI